MSSHVRASDTGVGGGGVAERRGRVGLGRVGMEEECQKAKEDGGKNERKGEKKKAKEVVVYTRRTKMERAFFFPPFPFPSGSQTQWLTGGDRDTHTLTHTHRPQETVQTAASRTCSAESEADVMWESVINQRRLITVTAAL